MEKGIIIHTLIINQGKILILKRIKQGDPLNNQWDFPGGTLEDGEEPILGAKREIREETGLTVKDLQLFYCVSNIDAAKNKQFITLIFLGKTKVNPKKVKLSKREHGEFKWIKLDEFRKYHVVNFVKECVSFLKSHNYEM